MAGNARRNKARNQVTGGKDAPWFLANVKRQRNRNKMAKASRKKNRK